VTARQSSDALRPATLVALWDLLSEETVNFRGWEEIADQNIIIENVLQDDPDSTATCELSPKWIVKPLPLFKTIEWFLL
jgi:hypothetical protein